MRLDNGSTDDSRETLAERAGARVVRESRRGLRQRA
jgi:hypothetical protein